MAPESPEKYEEPVTGRKAEPAGKSMCAEDACVETDDNGICFVVI